MSTLATLNTKQPQYHLSAVTGFQKLTVSAHVNNVEKTASLPVLELKLQNEKETFTLYLRQMPDTPTYNALDILATARQLPALEHTVFNSLQVTNTEPEALNASEEIILQFTVSE